MFENFIFDAFNEGTHYQKAINLTAKLFNKPVKISGASAIYATNKNRTFNTENKILSGFVPKGKKGKK